MRDEYVLKSVRYDENNEEIMTFSKRKPRHAKGSQAEYYNNYVQRYIAREAVELLNLAGRLGSKHERMLSGVLGVLRSKYEDLKEVEKPAGAIDMFYVDCEALKKQLAQIRRTTIAVNGVKIFGELLGQHDVTTELDRETLVSLDVLCTVASRLEDISRIEKAKKQFLGTMEK